ncbi:MAG: lamin tail domain-containing protein [Patescibacteria group bacterium]
MKNNSKIKNKIYKNYFAYLIGIFLFLIFFFPSNLFAQCSDNGYTIVYVNGIFTPTKKLADADRDKLMIEYQKHFNISDITFRTGYNPSHLAGLGDLIESASQIYNTSISDYDFKAILAQIHLEVKTKKIILVGYSQGSLYANEMYNYLVNNGIPKESIFIYNIATPANYVAGNGEYLTSKEDGVINSIRGVAMKVNGPQPLPGNVDIFLTEQENNDSAGGHSFSQSYLKKAPSDIISGVNSGLEKLKNSTETTEVKNGCFNLPDQNFIFKTQGILFSISDPIANGTVTVAKTTGKVAVYTGEKIVETSVFVIDSAQKTAIFVADKTQEVAITVAKTTNKIIETTNIKVKNIYNNIVSLEKPIAKIEPNIVVNNNVLSLNLKNNKIENSNLNKQQEITLNQNQLELKNQEIIKPIKQEIKKTKNQENKKSINQEIKKTKNQKIIKPNIITLDPNLKSTSASKLTASSTLPILKSILDLPAKIISPIPALASDIKPIIAKVPIQIFNPWLTSSPALLYSSTLTELLDEDKNKKEDENKKEEKKEDESKNDENKDEKKDEELKITLDTTPVTTTASTTAVFSFSSNKINYSFQCSLDNQEYQDCVSPATFDHLSLGDHLFKIRPVNQSENSENSDLSLIKFQWQIVEKNILITEIRYSNDNDKFIELYNPNSKEINLSNYSIQKKSETESIIYNFKENSIIPASGYFLIADNKAENQNLFYLADMSLNLSVNKNDTIYLVKNIEKAENENDNDVVDTINLNIIQEELQIKQSLNRKQIVQEYVDTNDSQKDFEAQSFSFINSKNETNPTIISKETLELKGMLEKDIVLTATGSPYVFKDFFIIDEDSTLTIEPGVTIISQVKDNTTLIISGKLIAKGTKEKPIIFTRLDKESKPASHSQIYFTSESNGSILDYVVFKYEDTNIAPDFFFSTILINQAKVEIKNSIFKKSIVFALDLIDSESIVESSIFENNAMAGILIEGNQPEIKND